MDPITHLFLPLNLPSSLILLALALLAYPFFVIPQSVPTYTKVSCRTEYNYTAFSPFQISLNRLLNRKLFNEGAIAGFYNATEGESPDKVYGLFLCRGDVSAQLCQDCIDAASQNLLVRCPNNKEALIWYDECLVRYSNRSFFSAMESTPSLQMYNTNNVTEPQKFSETLANMLNNLSYVAVSDPTKHMYATQEVNVSAFVNLYGLVQCTPDLSAQDCQSCLHIAIAKIPLALEGKSGMRVLQPSCSLRYELYSFHGGPRVDAQAIPPPPDMKPTTYGNSDSTLIAVSTSVSIVFVMALLGGIFIYRKRKNSKQGEDASKQELHILEWREGTIPDNYSHQEYQFESQTKSQDFPSIPLDVVCSATKQFSLENKLGEGGFGPVYKGILSDGKEIAVKRLSRSSGQGLIEFKNEITLIARLQHRNLVRLLGCCLERNETLLIYEYMPNKSLDFFLFGSSMGVQLDWKRRSSIINGIARGILYLHEDSRLRIIHRDLKASNVLLDGDMNPKISDFGMARIVGGNQVEANTNRVVGTYGYMAPEYAMEGLFSIKSDVFSFGVLLLEIISGKKNSKFYISEQGHSLLTYAWKLWSEGRGLELMEPLLAQSYSVEEAVKCIHVGLLCVQEDPGDRPTMSSVVLMLGSETVTLPQPTEPAFSVGRVVARSPNSLPIANKVWSANDVTCTDVSPR